MRRMLCVAVIGLVALWNGGVRVSAQKQQQLFISITAPDGKPVTDLKQDEVTITEDGVDCKTVKLEPIDWPIKLQVLVDNGKATTTPINSMRDGLKAFFEQLPDGVETSLYVTAGSPRPIVKAATDRQKLIDAIPLIAPDNGVGSFFDAIIEATGRVDKDKTPHFPVIVMVASDLGRATGSDRDYQKMQETVLKRAATVHVIMLAVGGGLTLSGGSAQTEIGLSLTKMTGGRYDNINSVTRLATLLPEIGKKIADSNAHQSHQFRVTYERPAGSKNPQPRIGASVSREGAAMLSLDGHLP